MGDTEKRGHGLVDYFQMVCLTAMITFAYTGFPLGLLIGIPTIIQALAVGVLLVTLAGAPIWLAVWKLGRRLGWRDDKTAVFAALVIGLAWVASSFVIDANLPSNWPRADYDPIVLGMIKSAFPWLAVTSPFALLVAPFVAKRFYGERRA